MLCPEVTTFPVPLSRRHYQTGEDVGKLSNSLSFEQNNPVIGNVKIFLPESIHPPDDLRRILLHDKDSYKIEKLSSLECLATEDFITTFLRQGSLVLQTAYGKF